MLRCVFKRQAAGLAFAALSASIGLAPEALAGGSLKDEPVAAPEEAYVWDGLYVGAGIGVGRVDHGIGVDAWKRVQKQKCEKKYEGPSIASLETFEVESIYSPCYWVNDGYPQTYPLGHKEFDDNSWEGFGTLQVGYDRLIHERILIGAFADIDFYPDADHSFGKVPHPPKLGEALIKVPFGPQVSGNFSLNHIWNIGGRIGFLVRPRLLLYATGGYSRADIDGDLKVGFDHLDPVDLSLSDHMSGFFIGGGGELKLDKNVSLKFEYRFTDLGSASASGSSRAANLPCHGGMDSYSYVPCREVTTLKAKEDLDLQVHSVRAALVIKLDDIFHHEEPAPLK